MLNRERGLEDMSQGSGDSSLAVFRVLDEVFEMAKKNNIQIGSLRFRLAVHDVDRRR